MELADLKTLLSVVEHGSITRAAKALNRVPSGITTRILHLEEDLGVKLFLREKKRLFVTPEGKGLYEYARRIVDLASEAERYVKNAAPGGKFRIGAMESTAAARLPGPLAKLHARYPLLELELTTGTSRFLREQLLDNRLDAAFVADIGFDDRLAHVSAFEEELVLIAHEAHEPIHEPGDISDKTMLAFKDGCSYRSRMLRWFSAYNLVPGRIAELASYHAIMGGTAAGMGIGLIPMSVLELFSNRFMLSIHPLAHPLGRVPTALAWRKGMPSANISALQECLTD
jgi:DNA-binding transcriptional LysR family regulator